MANENARYLRAAKSLALLTVVTALFDWKTVLTNQFTLLVGAEGVNYTYSWLHFWIRSLRNAHAPLWDPFAFCGRPFAAEMLPSAFYPLHLVLLLVPFNRNGLFSPRLYNEIFAFSHLLCLCFTYGLIRELNLSRLSAFVGACAFSLSSMLGNIPWPPFLEGAIWLPAIFLFTLRALRSEDVRTVMCQASLSGLCLGMSILTGGLHFSIMQGIFIVCAVLCYGGSTAPRAGPTRIAHWRRISLILTVVLVVSAGCGAVQLLPAFEYSRLSLRFIDGGPFPAGDKIPYSRLHPGMWPQSIVSTIFPFAYGGQIGGGERWAIYIGVFPFFLAVIAIWKCWQSVWVRYLTGVAVLAFLYTLGEFSPLHGWLYAAGPLLWVVRTASRFVYLITFSLAVLSAFGLETLLNRNIQRAAWRPVEQVLKWIALASAIALFVPAIFSQLNLGIWVGLSLLLILASCGWFSYLIVSGAGTSSRVLLVAFILFDLTAFHWAEINRAAPNNPDDLLRQIISLRGVADFLRTQPELGRVRVAVSPEPNIGDVYGVQSAWGGGGTLLTSYSRLRSHQDLLNVRYTVKPASVAEPAPIYQDDRWKVYENSNAFPRAWLVHKTIVEKSQEAVFRLIDDPAVNLRQVALLEAPPLQALQDTAATNEQTRFIAYETDHIALQATADSPGLMVMSEMYYPGWRATVNGKPTAVLRVDGGLRGIEVPRGQSRIELKYRPSILYLGGVLTLVTLGGVASALALTWGKSAPMQV